MQDGVTKRSFAISCWAAVGVCCITFLAGGCANPINAKTAYNYYKRGAIAEEQGDLERAREAYYRSYVNTEVGWLGPAAQAHALYEWTRVNGYLGNRAFVETNFPRVLELITKAKGDADSLRTPTLCEFARFLNDTGQHERAVRKFREALAGLDAVNADKADPIGLAEFLDDYARALKLSGSRSEADAITKRAQTLREANPGKTSAFKAQRYK
jgi:tetratricopeptide (TPR) repeat protein